MAPAIAERRRLSLSGAAGHPLALSFTAPFHGGPLCRENPPRGAIIDYYLKKKPKDDDRPGGPRRQGRPGDHAEQQGRHRERIRGRPDAPEDSSKKTVLTTEAGVNRVAWDLQGRGADVIKGAKIDSGDP